MGLSSGTKPTETPLTPLLEAAVLAPDGDYLVAGYTNPQGASSYDFLLMKIDVDGNMVWNKTYGGTGSERSLFNGKSGRRLCNRRGRPVTEQ